MTAGPEPAPAQGPSADPASFESFAAKARGTQLSNAAAARARGSGLATRDLSALSEETLWEAHARALSLAASGQGAEPLGPGEASLLELKASLAERLLGPTCRVCFLRCPVDRRAGEQGACGLGPGLRPYQDFVHLGEELELVPTHAVYLAGCNYRCAYCSDWQAVIAPEQIAEVSPEVLAASIDARRREGALSLSFVGGVPDVSLPAILRALTLSQVSTPLVWNTNLSASEEAAELLAGLVDCYVADLKYGSEACAQNGSALKGSLARAQALLARVAGEAYLVVRHLVLPGHVRCCAEPALRWIAAQLPGARVNLMGQYLPPPQVAGTPWDRLPRADELAEARACAASLDLDLSGPGRIAGGPRGGSRADSDPSAPAAGAPPAAGFSSEIRIEPGGRVVIENLSPELAELIAALGDELPELQARREAGGAWSLDLGEGPGSR